MKVAGSNSQPSISGLTCISDLWRCTRSESDLEDSQRCVWCSVRLIVYYTARIGAILTVYCTHC